MDRLSQKRSASSISPHRTAGAKMVCIYWDFNRCRAVTASGPDMPSTLRLAIAGVRNRVWGRRFTCYLYQDCDLTSPPGKRADKA